MTVEIVEVLHGGLDREHRERKAVVEAVEARLPPEPVEELPRQAGPDRSLPIEELPPQGHVAESTGEHVRRGQVRGRKQPTVRLEVVEPRRPDHADGPAHALEEGGQLGPAPAHAVGGERGVAVRLDVLEMEADPLVAQPSVGEAAGGRHHGRPGHGVSSSHVEAVRPLARVVGGRQAAQVLLPGRMRGVEVAAEAEPDVEVGVVHEHGGQRSPRQGGERGGEVELEIEERLGVDHAGGAHSRRRGSSRSRRASPSMLKAKTASVSARPGKIDSHGARTM